MDFVPVVRCCNPEPRLTSFQRIQRTSSWPSHSHAFRANSVVLSSVVYSMFRGVQCTALTLDEQ